MTNSTYHLQPVVIVCTYRCGSALAMPADTGGPEIAARLTAAGWAYMPHGAAWSCSSHSAAPVIPATQAAPVQVVHVAPSTAGRQHRADLLDTHLSALIRRGWRIDLSDGTRARVSRPWLWMPPFWHLTLSLITAGFWLPIWITSLSPRCRRSHRHLMIDPHTGQIVTTQA